MSVLPRTFVPAGEGGDVGRRGCGESEIGRGEEVVKSSKDPETIKTSYVSCSGKGRRLLE